MVIFTFIVFIASISFAKNCDSDLCNQFKAESRSNTQVEILDIYERQDKSFTQGLLWHSGYLYETTGLYKISKLM